MKSEINCDRLSAVFAFLEGSASIDLFPCHEIQFLGQSLKGARHEG